MGDYAAKSTSIDSPVTYAQVGQMVDYIAQNNPDYQDGKTVNEKQIDWPAVNEHARTIMTPDQFDLFTHITANTATRQKFDRAVDAIIEAARKQNAADEQ